MRAKTLSPARSPLPTRWPSRPGKPPRALTAFAVARPGDLVLVAHPDPPAVAPASAHPPDTKQDFRRGPIELTRVIELSSTRTGPVRPGRSAFAPAGSEDGFAPDFLTAAAATVALMRYPSAGTARGATRDAKIDLVDLARGIERYDPRLGTVRTGVHRSARGTEDGNEPVP